MGSISFARKIGNTIEMVTIPTTSFQKFHYFYNPSKLTTEERKKKYEKEITRSLLLDSAIKTTLSKIVKAETDAESKE